MTLVANNIKYLRRMNGLTQEQFARKIGIKRSLLGAYEEGRANPNLDNLMNIAKIFGTTVDNLLKNDIRRLRESQGIPIPQPAPHLQAKVEPEAPKPLASIIEKYYRQPVAQAPSAEPKPAVGADTLILERSQPNLFRQPIPESVPPPAPASSPKPQAGSIEWVSRELAGEYLARYAYPDFLKGLPQMSLPGLPSGKYRAFQPAGDFPVEGATVVGAYVNNWYDIRDGGHYLVVVHKQGILYRRLYNQVKTKGSLLLLSDMPGIPPFEVSIKDVLEIWESKAFVSYQMPEPRPAAPLDGLTVLVQEMQRELERLQK